MKDDIFYSFESMKPITIRIDEKDIQQLKELAEKKGLKYQTLIRMVVREYINSQDTGKQ